MKEFLGMVAYHHCVFADETILIIDSSTPYCTSDYAIILFMQVVPRGREDLRMMSSRWPNLDSRANGPA